MVAFAFREKPSGCMERFCGFPGVVGDCNEQLDPGSTGTCGHHGAAIVIAKTLQTIPVDDMSLGDDEKRIPRIGHERNDGSMR